MVVKVVFVNSFPVNTFVLGVLTLFDVKIIIEIPSNIILAKSETRDVLIKYVLIKQEACRWSFAYICNSDPNLDEYPTLDDVYILVFNINVDCEY